MGTSTSSGPQSSSGPFVPTSSVVTIGTDRVTLPVVVSPTTLVTLGETFTIVPPPETTPQGSSSTRIPIGSESASSQSYLDTTQPASSSIRDTTESETATSPIIPGPSTIVTSGSTFTILPPVSKPSLDNSSPPSSIPNTGSDDSTTRSDTSTQDRDTESPATTVRPDTSGEVSTTGFPSATEETTVTTKDQTLAPSTGAPPSTTITRRPSERPPSRTDESQATFTQWPPEAGITPVEVEVDQPEPSKDDDDSAVIPCTLWFFSACIRFDDIHILSWKISLPPGVYPPGPPPIGIIDLPGPIGFQGELPPWPEFTVGPDHVPTFPPGPKPTECETKTASICSTTTSFIVSTVNGSPTTVSSRVLPPTCAGLRGCLVADSTREASVTRTQCATKTVTNVVVTCSGTGTAACSTRTGLRETGCDVTATTTTVSCTPAPTGNNKRQEGDGGSPACPIRRTYVIWPRDGTKTDETGAIYSEIRKIVQDEDGMRVSEANGLGVNFWRVSMDADQAKKVKAIRNVASVHIECTSGCVDPTTADTNWRYQDWFLEDVEVSQHQRQMSFLSNNEADLRDKFNSYYFYDVSAGQDIPVYVPDTGAQMDHPEFTEGDNIAAKTEFLFVGNDYDGKQHRDDSGAKLGGACDPEKCNPHGTSMLSVLAGANLGIAKKVKPIVVRAPRRHEDGSGASPEDWLETLVVIHNLFPNESEMTLAIVSMSWTYSLLKYKRSWMGTNPQSTDQEVAESFELFKTRLRAILRNLIRKGLFVVTGSGNTGVMESYPALFGGEDVPAEHRIPELLVVGATDMYDGKIWGKSGRKVEAKLPHIYAPGASVLVANGDMAAPRYKQSAGTSIATAYTAGLAAYFLKLHQLGRLPADAKGNRPDMSPAGLKRYIINNSWVRLESDPGVLGIWNGAANMLLAKDGYCRYVPGETSTPMLLRRQEKDDEILTGQCVPGTSPTSVPFVCTEETVGRCSPGVVCSAPMRNGCENGKCVCVMPEPPKETTTKPPPRTTMSTATSRPEPTPTKVPLELGERFCNDASVYTGGGDVARSPLELMIFRICVGTGREDKRMSPGKEPLVYRSKANGVPYFLSISWKDGCETTVDSALPGYPLGQGKVECGDLFYDNWRMCTGNKGRGGYIDAGCLRYEFTPKE
ncbi:hypothetical protein CMUS01_10593 [Colletotrichum musicola]|uniref:Peptidase S8/S53 domain-containing protein n=1 Tax=Colletotrichum musicola TaxID=2175873 RepID=A0A8H6K399_9PEZI|nr:hypothetical protein CMUS01_10593 [Colletotrichum musicola]